MGEALRRPGLEERTRAFYLGVHGQLEELARRWCEEGQVAANADSRGIATVLMTLMPGLLVGRHLVAPVSAEHLIAGLSSLGTASWNS